MRNATKNYIDQLLIDYPHIEKEIESIKESIRTPYMEHDENSYMPGGNEVSKSLENTVIKISDSKILRQLEYTRKCLKAAIDTFTEDEKEFSKHYYFTYPREKTIQGIAIEMNYSKSKLYEIRTSIRKIVARECRIL